MTRDVKRPSVPVSSCTREKAALDRIRVGENVRRREIERCSKAKSILPVLAVLIVCILFGSFPLGAKDEASLSGLVEEAQAAFDERYVEERMVEAIALYEAILPRIDPTETQSRTFVLNRLSQLCYEATTFSPGDTAEDRELFERGRSYGLESLRSHPDFARVEEDDFVVAVSNVNDAAALLWTADNWGGLCGMNPIEGLLHFGKVRTLYERCLAIDETFWGASPHNALGAMLVVTPAALGGDTDAGLAHLETALALAPTYLLNRVVRAQYWGFTYNLLGQIDGIRDAAFIESELTAVLDEPIGDWPFWNREALEEAVALLQKLDEMIP